MAVSDSAPLPHHDSHAWTPYRSEGVSKVAPHSMHCHLTTMMSKAAAAKKGNGQQGDGTAGGVGDGP